MMEIRLLASEEDEMGTGSAHMISTETGIIMCYADEKTEALRGEATQCQPAN